MQLYPGARCCQPLPDGARVMITGVVCKDMDRMHSRVGDQQFLQKLDRALRINRDLFNLGEMTGFQIERTMYVHARASACAGDGGS